MNESIETGPMPTWEVTVTVIPLTLIIIFIILGNFLVVVAILTQKSLRTPSNIYILSLALADLSVGIFILPYNVIHMVHHYEWQFSKTFCRIWLTSDVTLCSTSILHISAIAVDRFRSINEGLSYANGRTKTMACVVCGALWFLALWIASPPVLGWNDWADQNENMCMLTRTSGYIVHSATGAFFIPGFVMAGLYIKIFFLLRKKFRERAGIKCIEPGSHDLDHSTADTANNSLGDIIEENATENTDTNSSKTANSIAVVIAIGQGTIKSTSSNKKPPRKHSEQISAILKKKIKFSLTKERKAARTLGILIGAFLICWTPFTLTYLISGYFPDFVHDRFFEFVTWLGYVNSGINPVIYTVYSQEFRKAFHRVLSCKRY